MRKPRCALPMISLALSSSGIILLRQTFTGCHLLCDISSQGLHTDNVGVDAGSSAVVGAHAVKISRFRNQPSDTSAGHVAHVEVLIPGQESAKDTAGRYIQPVARGSGYTAPVSCEPTRGNVRGGAGRRRGGHGRHTDDVGVDAGSSASVGARPIIIGPASAQPAHTPADYVAHTEILIPGHETAKGTAGGHIQQVA